MSGLQLLASSMEEVEATGNKFPSLPSISSLINSERASEQYQTHPKPQTTVLPSIDSLINKTVLNIASTADLQNTLPDEGLKTWKTDGNKTFKTEGMMFQEHGPATIQKVDKKMVSTKKEIRFHKYDRDKPKIKLPSMPAEAFVMVKKEDGDFFQCTYGDCKTLFSKRGTNAKSHWFNHIDARPYVCDICNESFGRHYSWKRHRATHAVTRSP